jgi:hypothetical protein
MEVVKETLITLEARRNVLIHVEEEKSINVIFNHAIIIQRNAGQDL